MSDRDREKQSDFDSMIANSLIGKLVILLVIPTKIMREELIIEDCLRLLQLRVHLAKTHDRILEKINSI